MDKYKYERGKTMYITKRKYKIPVQLFLFSVFFAIYMFTATLAGSTYNQLIYTELLAVRYLCYAGFIITDLYKFKSSKKQMFLLAVLILASLIVSVKSGDNKLFCILIILVAAKGIDREYIAKLFVTVKGAAILFVVGSFFAGIITENTNTRLWQTEIRHSLGFNYSNNLSSFFFLLVAAYIYMKKNKVSIWEQAVILAVNYVIFYYTDAQTSFILVIMALLFCDVIKLFDKVEWYRYHNIFRIITLVFFIIPILTGYLYNGNQLFLTLNSFFSNRLNLVHNALNYYGVSLFGTHALSNAANTSIMVDSGIVRMFLFGGIIPAVFFGCVFVKMVDMYSEKNEIYMVILIFLIFIQGWMEAFTFEIVTNYFLFLIPSVLEKKNRNKQRIAEAL